MKNRRKVVKVRDLLVIDPIEMKNKLHTNLNILFEDNITLFLSYKEVILLRFILDVYNIVPELKITSKQCFTNFYNNNTYTSKTINKSFEVIVEDVVECYCKPQKDRKILDHLYYSMYVVLNNIYNYLTYESLEYCSSINVLEFLEIQMNNELLTSMKDAHVHNNHIYVNNTYDVLDKVLKLPEIQHNQISKGYLSGNINPNQVKQMLASRGFITEIDSSIFKYPIASSFTLGLKDIYDLAIESRSGAKALYLSTNAIREAEYLARELQLVTMLVSKLIDDDCGNHDYIDWLVRSKELGYNKDDLGNLIGKYYYNTTTKKEELITSKHTHLIGKVIKLRSVINCKLKDPTTICTKCFGDLSYSIPLHSNIGHYSSTSVTQKITQSILSTKHLSSSATSHNIQLDQITEKFLNLKDGTIYMFKSGILNNKFIQYDLIIEQEYVFGLKDLNINTDILKLEPYRVSRISNFIIQSKNIKTGEVEYFPITISTNRNRGSFTYEFLNYIVNSKYTLDNEDRYVIPLNEWSANIPFIITPELEYNFQALAKELKSLLRDSSNVKNNTTKRYTPESLLQRLFDLINSKLSVNIAVLEVIVYAMTVKSLENRDFNLGRNVSNKTVTDTTTILEKRSLGAGYGWEKVIKLILNPNSFYSKNKIKHPMDIMIKPDEIIRKNYIKN